MGSYDDRIDDLLLAGYGVQEVREVLGIRAVSEAEVYDRRAALRKQGHALNSPYGMVQERVRAGDKLDGWRIAVASALMNRTHARQVRPILNHLFAHWPTPAEMSRASQNLEDLIRPLGFVNIRAKRLRIMSLDHSMGVPIERCHGIGVFGVACVKVFRDGRTDVEHSDGFLTKYVEWVKAGRVS